MLADRALELGLDLTQTRFKRIFASSTASVVVDGLILILPFDGNSTKVFYLGSQVGSRRSEYNN